jgi:hypothetical protein
MVGMLMTSLLLSLVRGVLLPGEDTYNGPHTGLLSAGQLVTPRAEFKASDASRAVTAGASCMVRVDLAGDEDDCNPRRLIEVEIREGPHRGSIMLIPRELLTTR